MRCTGAGQTVSKAAGHKLNLDESRDTSLYHASDALRNSIATTMVTTRRLDLVLPFWFFIPALPWRAWLYTSSSVPLDYAWPWRLRVQIEVEGPGCMPGLMFIDMLSRRALPLQHGVLIIEAFLRFQHYPSSSSTT